MIGELKSLIFKVIIEMYVDRGHDGVDLGVVFSRWPLRFSDYGFPTSFHSLCYAHSSLQPEILHFL